MLALPVSRDELLLPDLEDLLASNRISPPTDETNNTLIPQSLGKMQQGRKNG